MKINRPIRNYILVLSLLHISMHKNEAQSSRNGLRQKQDVYKDVGLNNSCDDKIYAITEIGNLFEIEKIENKENTIKQFGMAIPFKCNAFVKSLNNVLYAVKGYEESRTPVFEYNPRSKQGDYTKWMLPSNRDGGWVSGAVDSKGRLYFMSTTMENLIRIDLQKDEMKKLWSDNTVVLGWKKENCSQGCNFYINQQDELVVKENRGSGVWNISINNGYRVVKVDMVNVEEETNPTNDIMEYVSESNVRMNLLLGRNTIFNYSKKKNEAMALVKIDTLKVGIFTEIAGCNNFLKSEERIIEEEKDELITFSTNINESIRLKNIIFKLGESELQPASFLELDKLVKQLKKYRQVEILLEGHTDISGDADENIKLSLERVNSCKKYLVNKGIEARRIQTIGLGSSRPLKRSGNEKEREINRRVEFKVIKGIG